MTVSNLRALLCHAFFTIAFLSWSPRAPAQAVVIPLHIYSVSDTGRVLDANGFLLNPSWRGSMPHDPPDIEQICAFRTQTKNLERRSMYTTFPDCLSAEERRLVSLNEPASTLGLGAVCVTSGKVGNIRGHVNWFPITSTGKLIWNSYSGGVGDHDVNIDLVPPIGKGAVTSENARPRGYHRRGYHTEFYDWETLDRIPDQGRSFWQSLKIALSSDLAASGLVDNRFGMVTGTYGLDGVHNFHAELHPVLSMAILIDSASQTPGTVREQWAVMIRNLGSEGDCAEGTLPLLTSSDSPLDQHFLIDLGDWPGAGRPFVGLESSWTSDTTFPPKVHLTGEHQNHVYLDFRHLRPTPSGHDFVFLGTFSIEWKAAGLGKWRERLGDWVPKDGGPLNLAQQPDAMCSVPKSQIENSSASYEDLPKSAGAEKPVFLSCMRPQESVDESNDSIKPDAPLLVYRSPPWPLYDLVRRYCETLAQQSNPICRKPRSIGLGLSGKSLRWNRLFPMLSYYILPHSVFPSKEGLLWDLVRSFGYRFDLRRDQFFPISKNGATAYYGSEVSGPSLRGSILISPNNARVFEALDFMPYTIADFGFSRSSPGGTSLTWGWGVGIEARAFGRDFFAEIQDAIRAGGYVGNWVFSSGVLVSLPR